MVVHAYNFSTCGVEARGSEAQGPQLYEFETSLHEVHLKKQKKKKENLKQNETKPKQLKCEFLLEEVTVFLMYSSAGPTAHTCVYLKRRQETVSVSTPYFLGSQLWFECAMSPIG